MTDSGSSAHLAPVFQRFAYNPALDYPDPGRDQSEFIRGKRFYHKRMNLAWHHVI